MSDLNEVIDNLKGIEQLLNSISFKEILTGDRLSEEKVEKSNQKLMNISKKSVKF